MSHSTITIINARIVTSEDEAGIGHIVIENGRIRELGKGPLPTSSGQVIDGHGAHLTAGLIDLQVNGGFGHDFTADPSCVRLVADRLPRHGVTGFLATIITSPPAVTDIALASWSALAEAPPSGARILGWHFEGPFLSPGAAGAHDSEYLRTPSLSESWTQTSGLRLVTLAPELPGALTLIRELAERGIVASAGHSRASYDQGRAGCAAGIRYATHLFNTMPPLHHREPGLVAAVLEDPSVTIGIIPDGVHLHPAIVSLVMRQIGSRRLNLVTDAMAAMGMPDGDYPLGGRSVRVAGGSARLSDGRLAGSILTLDEAVRRAISYSGARFEEIIPSVTSVPADLIGIDAGRIRIDAKADLVLWDETLHVRMTFVEGCPRYVKES